VKCGLPIDLCVCAEEDRERKRIRNRKGVGVPETAKGASSPKDMRTDNKTRILDKSLGRRVKPQTLSDLQEHLGNRPKAAIHHVCIVEDWVNDLIAIVAGLQANAQTLRQLCPCCENWNSGLPCDKECDLKEAKTP